MFRQFFTAGLGLALAAVFVSTAVAGPVTSSVDVQLNDALVLAAPGEMPAFGGSAGTGAAINAAYPGALSAEGVILVDTLAGPSDWASSVRLQYSVATSASVTGIGSAASAPPSTTINIPPGSIFSFPSGGISTTSSVGAAPTFAEGTASVPTPLSAEVNASTGVGATVAAFASSTANSFNRVLEIVVADAATLAALGVGGGGTDSFAVNLYLNTLLASIDLDTTSSGDFAFAEFAVTANAAVNGTGVDSADFSGSDSASNGEDLDGSVPAPVGGDFTALGPSTAGALGATPFLSFSVSAEDVIRININVTSTSQAEVINPIPEPSSLALFGFGALVVGAAARRRRRRSAVVNNA